MARLHTDVGKCIYCAGTKPPLTREHVLPRGLGGSIAPEGKHEALVLQRASCESCRRMTQQIEDECLRGRFWPIRSHLKLDRKDRRPSHVRIQLEFTDGTIEARRVKPETAHAAILMTHFDKAEVLDFRQRSQMPRIKTIFPPEFSIPASKHGAAKVGVQAKADNPRFAQMLAKIGLGLAVAEYGVDGFHPLVRDFIRFLPNDYRHWVGGRSPNEDLPGNALHCFRSSIVRTQFGGAFIIVDIRLFASYGAPTNYVVVGKPLVPDIPDKRARFSGEPPPLENSLERHRLREQPNRASRRPVAKPDEC
jgi:hypothetical protein